MHKNQLLVPSVSRRRLFQVAAGQAITLPLINQWMLADVHAAENYEPLNRFPQMVHEWFVRKVRDAERRKLHRLDRLKTKSDAEAYVNR